MTNDDKQSERPGLLDEILAHLADDPPDQLCTEPFDGDDVLDTMVMLISTLAPVEAVDRLDGAHVWMDADGRDRRP